MGRPVTDLRTQSGIFLAAKRELRRHPEWADEDVLKELGLHKFDLPIVATARRDLAATDGQCHD
jgi:hypothetical protein